MQKQTFLVLKELNCLVHSAEYFQIALAFAVLTAKQQHHQ
jgi:hypothetical protein